MLNSTVADYVAAWPAAAPEEKARSGTKMIKKSARRKTGTEIDSKGKQDLLSVRMMCWRAQRGIG